MMALSVIAIGKLAQMLMFLRGTIVVDFIGSFGIVIQLTSVIADLRKFNIYYWQP